MSDKRWRFENPSAHYATLASPTEPHPWRDTALGGHWRDTGQLESCVSSGSITLRWRHPSLYHPPNPTNPTQPCIFLAALGSWPSSSISVKLSFDHGACRRKKTAHNMQRKEIFSAPPPRSCERPLSLHRIFLQPFSSSDQMQNAGPDTKTNMELIHQKALRKLCPLQYGATDAFFFVWVQAGAQESNVI